MPLLSPSRILRAATQNTSAVKWSETLALPRSTFPARPSATQLEQYRRRCADDLYAWQAIHRPQFIRDSLGKETNNLTILHDGPPYANGAVHIGHALNKILKDLVIRWNLAKGRRVQYRPGWDCHGLPIELKALQAQRTNEEQSSSLHDKPKQEAAVATGFGMSAADIRAVARTLASNTIEKQKASFREWGVMGDWDKPYKTMDLEFEISQLEVFRKMVNKGLISRSFRPVYWSPSSRTALAEAELEYDENHKCTAAFVKMPFVRLPKVLRDNERLRTGQVSALIWTTTPWTLPANKAIAVNEDLEYAVIAIDSSEHGPDQDYMVVARDRIEYVLSHLPEGCHHTLITESVTGLQLADGQGACLNIFNGSESPILTAGYVTSTSGTGLVHTAPGHGMEDYQLCEMNNVGPPIAPVNDEGRYTHEAFPNGVDSDILSDLDVQTDGVKTVLDILRDPTHHISNDLQTASLPDSLLLATHEFTHKNPIDWRTKQPVIVRATAQWFADVSAIKDRALTALKDVKFVPESGKTRLKSFVEGRNQWCISRQRSWGVPIPVLYHQETGEACIRQESINHIIQTIKEKGTDAWFSDEPDDRSWVHPSLEEDTWVRGKDTMDVWFDSGTTWTTLRPRDGQHLSDVYLEGTDQHRGWFQSSLLTNIATQHTDNGTRPKAPFGTLITHGFTLDADGKKMSKSLGNVISPDQILDGSLLPPVKVKKQRGNKKQSAAATDEPKYDAMGPDVLRLWVASSDYTRDISVSVPVLQSVQQALQKLRVTFKFLLGVLGDYALPSQSSQPPTGALTFADRAILHQLSKTSQNVWAADDEYKFYKAVSDINTFVSTDLSAFYFEIVKDAAYAGSREVRRRTQGVLATILEELMNMLGPITPHLIEEIWEHFPPGMKNSDEHPLKRVWESPYTSPNSDKDIEWQLEGFRCLSTAVKIAQEEARNAGRIGSGLACDVVVLVPSQPADRTVLGVGKDLETWATSAELADLLVVSNAVVTSNSQDFEAAAKEAWKYEQDFNTPDFESGKVVVLPPKQHKCVRCWKYTAEESDQPCQRCQHVLQEMKNG